MAPMHDFAQLQLHFLDPIQWRYEVIRPLVLGEEATPTQRAQETHTHPNTVRTFTRRFRQQGMLELLPKNMEVITSQRARKVSEAIIQEIARLKPLYSGFRYRELGRIVLCKFGSRLAVNTIKKLWQHSLPAAQGGLALGDYHSYPDRYQARVQVIKLDYQGWNKLSISRVLHVSRPTVDRWIARFEAEHFAGLVDKSRAPQVPARKVWLPLMIDVYHLQKRHPDAGGFRIWSLLAQPEISVRTVERIIALNRQLYDDIPHGRPQGPQQGSCAASLQSHGPP